MSQIIEPMLLYHSFVMSPYETLINDKSPFLQPTFVYRIIEKTPRLVPDLEKTIDLLIYVIFNGIQDKPWHFIESVAKSKIPFPGQKELFDSMTERKSISGLMRNIYQLVLCFFLVLFVYLVSSVLD